MISKMRKERTLAYFERHLLVKIDSFRQAIHKVPYAQAEGEGVKTILGARARDADGKGGRKIAMHRWWE
jgi:hypothetical protein